MDCDSALKEESLKVEKSNKEQDKSLRLKFLKYRKRVSLFSSFCVLLLNAILLQIYRLN